MQQQTSRARKNRKNYGIPWAFTACCWMLRHLGLLQIGGGIAITAHLRRRSPEKRSAAKVPRGAGRRRPLALPYHHRCPRSRQCPSCVCPRHPSKIARRQHNHREMRRIGLSQVRVGFTTVSVQSATAFSATFVAVRALRGGGWNQAQFACCIRHRSYRHYSWRDRGECVLAATAASRNVIPSLFFVATLLLFSFWTSRGHRCRPFFSPVLAFNFYRA